MKALIDNSHDTSASGGIIKMQDDKEDSDIPRRAAGRIPLPAAPPVRRAGGKNKQIIGLIPHSDVETLTQNITIK